MVAGLAEPYWREICNHYGIDYRKYKDVSRCIVCGAAQPKSEKITDYGFWFGGSWVECKNDNSKGRWEWTELLPDGRCKLQREWLNAHGGYLFIMLGRGRLPKGKKAWLIPWKLWVSEIEPILKKRGQMGISLRSKRANILSAEELFDKKYELTWGKGNWLIPNGHIFWITEHTRLQLSMEFLAAMIK